MIKKNYKGRCEKKKFIKATDVCRLYNKIQIAYADLLDTKDEIIDFKCNVLLEGLDIGEYTTDFVCRKSDGTYRIRECVDRKQLLWPSVVNLLEASRQYWVLKRGVEDWGIVTNKEVRDGDK